MQGMSSMHDLFNKVKEAAGSLSTNEGEMTSGSMQLREDPPGRPTEGPGAPWGEGSISNEPPPRYSTAVEHEDSEGRGKLLERAFKDMQGMATADRGLVHSLFSHFGSPATTSHSPLLQKKASHAPPPTLAEAVRRLR
jgi:hypothetical protein